MPRTTGVDILNIKPDAEMGLAQDTNIPVPAVALDQVNKANDDLRLYDHQINLMKYQQKIKDRDKLLEGLEAGQVAVGDIEPEDKKYFDEAEQRARKAFLAVKTIEPDKNGQNKEYQEWLAAQQDLNDEANILQLRRVALQTLRKELAATISPSERKAREQHLAKMKAQSPYETITPFQKSLTVDFDKTFAELQKGALVSKGEAINVPQTTTTVKDANGKITTTTVEKPAPGTKPMVKSSVKPTTVGPDGYLNTEIELEPEKRWVLPGMMQNANKMYLDPSGEGFAQIQGIMDAFQGNPDDVPKRYLKQMNERLAQFHQQNEIGTIKIPDKRPGPVNPNNPGDTVGGEIDTGEYPYQINYRILPDGRIAIQDNPADFAAKLALANVAGDYVIKAKKGFDENAFKLNMEKAKNKADILLKTAQARAANARAAWTVEKIAGLKNDEEREKVIGDYWNTNILQQKELGSYNSDKGMYYLSAIPGDGSASLFAFKGTKNGEAKPVEVFPLGSTPIYGKDPANLATYGKIIGRTSGAWKPEIVFRGFPIVKDGKITGYSGGDYSKLVDRKVSMAEIVDIYEKYKKQGYQGTIDDYLRSLIRTGSVDYNLIGQDAEGRPTTVTKKDNTEALRALSNKNYKKGQESPFYEEGQQQ